MLNPSKEGSATSRVVAAVTLNKRAHKPQPQPRLRPDLKVIEGGKTATARRRVERLTPRIRLIALISMVGVVLFGVVAFHVVLSQGQFELTRLQAKAADQQDQYQRLRWEVAQLESPERITNEAIDRLGLVPADKVTPVTPSEQDLPNGRVDQTGQVDASSTDPGQWEKVKPHLSSSAK